MLQNFKTRSVDYYTKYGKQLEIGFFVGGFIFDILFLSEVDDLFSIAQQAIYLLIITTILHFEILFRMQKWRPTGSFTFKIWDYRELILHFALGSLLSSYSLFYIKSASFISSLIFLILMIALLIANELPLVKKSKVSFKMGLYAICLFSFISILFPVILGFVGWIPFALSVTATIAFFFLQVHLLRRQLLEEKTLNQAVFFPGVSVVLVFSLFYVLGWIPPVPISAKEQGIYHLIEKQNGQFLLSTQNSWLTFWRSGDQHFKARPGDKIYYYAQIYSPARFSDQVFVRWLFKDPKMGWQKTDRIALQISGGREAGFRAFTNKSNYQPGEWQIQLETEIGHEITRLSFEVELDPSTEPRAFELLVR